MKTQGNNAAAQSKTSSEIQNRLAALVAILSAAFAVFLISSPPAQASRARELVMFRGDPGDVLSGGSLFYETPYNIFYNPSYVNNFENWAVIEKSNGQGSAQAGAVARISGYSFGLYANRVEAMPVASPHRSQMRPVELFVGSGSEVRWGLSAGYGRYENTTNELSLRGGLQVSSWEPFAGYRRGRDRQGTTEYRSDEILVGVKYRLDAWTPYFVLQDEELKTRAEGAPAKSTSQLTAGGGLGFSRAVSEQVRLNSSLSFWRRADQTLLPFYLSLEGDVNSWLMLRGGFAFRKNSAGRLGATIHIGKMDLDWAFGNDRQTEALDAPNFEFGNGFFSSASLTYSW